MSRIREFAVAVVVVLGVSWFAGCAGPRGLPAPVEVRPVNHETRLAFDTNGDGTPDYWQYQGADGRKHAIALPQDGAAAPGPRIDLDAIPATDCPHFMIILDGVPFEVIDAMYREGHFRLFCPPVRAICCFPSLTDLAITQLLHSPPCIAGEALYYDREANRLSDGNAVYLSGRNAPWTPKVQYRCSTFWDAKAYLDPQAVFDHELSGILDVFSHVQSGQAIGYSVGTAGLGTRGGRDAIRAYMTTIDRICEQLVHDRQGRVKITLTADHGHCLTPCHRTHFDDVLKQGGYRSAKSLRDPHDVIVIAYGLVTYTAFYTKDAPGVATCVLNNDDVDLVCYPQDDAVVVRNRDGEARVRRGDHGYHYERRSGDPLRLAEVIDALQREGKVAADGEIDDRAFFAATVTHEYPDALSRVWDAFHGLMESPPDLIASLRDNACYGSSFFHMMIGDVASTHGSLNRINSTTFVLTTLGELPPAMRSGEVLPALDRLRGKS